MKISELSIKLVAARKEATASLEDVPLHVRPGREAARNAAIRQVEMLEADFKAAVIANAGYIVVKGEGELLADFIDIAIDEGEALVADADELSHELTAALWRHMPDRTLNSNHLTLFGAALGNILGNLGARATVPLHIGSLLSAGRVYRNCEELSADIKKTIRDAVGVELEVPYIQWRVAKEALLRTYKQNFVPVILTDTCDGDKELIEKLAGPDAVHVEVKDGNVEQQVKQAFKKLKDTLKNKRK